MLKINDDMTRVYCVQSKHNVNKFDGPKKGIITKTKDLAQIDQMLAMRAHM